MTHSISDMTHSTTHCVTPLCHSTLLDRFGISFQTKCVLQNECRQSWKQNVCSETSEYWRFVSLFMTNLKTIYVFRRDNMCVPTRANIDLEYPFHERDAKRQYSLVSEHTFCSQICLCTRLGTQIRYLCFMKEMERRKMPIRKYIPATTHWPTKCQSRKKCVCNFCGNAFSEMVLCSSPLPPRPLHPPFMRISPSLSWNRGIVFVFRNEERWGAGVEYHFQEI